MLLPSTLLTYKKVLMSLVMRCQIAPALHDFLAPSNRQLDIRLNLNLNCQTATLTGYPQHTNNSVA